MSKLQCGNFPQCRGKLSFATRKAAERHSDHLNSTPRCHAYHCPACAGFHIGKVAGEGMRKPTTPSCEARRERRYGTTCPDAETAEAELYRMIDRAERSLAAIKRLEAEIARLSL